MATPEDILSFWLDELTPEQWYTHDEALDQQIRDRFLDTWEQVMQGKFAMWLTYPSGALAYIILTDQMPRNMFRDSPKSFASDHLAKAVAKQAVHRGWDLKIAKPARQFFYMPLMHSENNADQDRCVRLMMTRLADGPDSLVHARVHREIIRRFGRFPYRNAALGRRNSLDEEAFLAGHGYAEILNELKALQAA